MKTGKMARLSYIVMIVGISLMCTFAQELYDSKYDYIDAKAILNDSKQRDEWFNCFKGLVPCPSPAAQYFADIFPEIVKTQCQKCTDKQKEMVKLSAEWFTKNKPEDWKTLVTSEKPT